ncbi:unnamed protein product, partial [Acanthoscelides obtectus]
NKSSSSNIQNSFIKYLTDKRQEATQIKTRGKKKKITVPAGQSIAHSEISFKDLTEASTSVPYKDVEPEIIEDVSEEDIGLDHQLPLSRNSSDDEINELQEME